MYYNTYFSQQLFFCFYLTAIAVNLKLKQFLYGLIMEPTYLFIFTKSSSFITSILNRSALNIFSDVMIYIIFKV